MFNLDNVLFMAFIFLIISLLIFIIPAVVIGIVGVVPE